jgi:uncharacterized membrane protein YjgN (DUF898 family)
MARIFEADAEAATTIAFLDNALPDDAGSLAQSEPGAPLRFEFTGTGAEYFRIWVVNLLFTVLTLGIYSAWAKVRRVQYFYRNTRLADAAFDYRGNPIAILKGRILALILLVAYKVSLDVSRSAAVATIVLLAAITPWLLARAFHFKMANSSYRGIQFRFSGTVVQAYRMLLLFPVVLGLTVLLVWALLAAYSPATYPGIFLVAGTVLVIAFGLTIPFAHYFLKRYQHDHATYGQTAFRFHATASDFFKIYGKAVGLFFLGSIPAAVFGFVTAGAYTFLLHTAFGWLFALLYGVLSAYAFYLFVRPYLESRIQNLVWNSTVLGEYRFESEAYARKLLWLHASNLMLITLTFGLYKPFATIRLLKYRVESVSLHPAGGLNAFLAVRDADTAGAVGQEAGDLFDIDIAL